MLLPFPVVRKGNANPKALAATLAWAVASLGPGWRLLRRVRRAVAAEVSDLLCKQWLPM
jgi:hypothetical protein